MYVFGENLKELVYFLKLWCSFIVYKITLKENQRFRE